MEAGASFITLTQQGKLRGCIGVIEPFRSLAEDVRENAMGAAFFDPRFPKVQIPELDGMAIEIAILSPLRRIDYQGEAELIEALCPGVDGVLVKDEDKRATFLPKVWEKIPDPYLFMGMLCRKMGVPEDTWQNQPLEIYVYQTESICES
jgi:AmmeMemoRadiSam system protein A